MDVLWQSLGFAVKGFIVFVTVVASFGAIVALARRNRRPGARLEVRPLNQRFEALGDALRVAVSNKQERKQLRQRRKAELAKPAHKPSLYVLDFDGDLFASAVTNLREEVSAIAQVAKEGDEVVVRLESPGGAVPHYGLAAAQLVRLRDRKLKVTVCIDRIAASGGYMMACVADRIVAAPFAFIGSIGVVAQVPNLHRLLKKYDVDFEEMTAGEFKRTVSVFGEVTEKGKKKFQEQLEETHLLFKAFVKAHRPALDVDQVSTGEYWLGTRALERGLVDQLGTSDDYLLSRTADATLYQVHYRPAHPWRARLGQAAAEAADRTVVKLLSRAMSLGPA